MHPNNTTTDALADAAADQLRNEHLAATPAADHPSEARIDTAAWELVERGLNVTDAGQHLLHTLLHADSSQIPPREQDNALSRHLTGLPEATDHALIETSSHPSADGLALVTVYLHTHALQVDAPAHHMLLAFDLDQDAIITGAGWTVAEHFTLDAEGTTYSYAAITRSA